MHGGAKGSGAQPGNKNALRHGRSCAEARQEQDGVRRLLEKFSFNYLENKGVPL